VARVDTRAKRQRGLIDRLPSGSLRVRVYAGIDPVTRKRHYLSETVPPASTERETLREAERVRTRLVNQVDERRNPRTRATMGELLDRWLDVVKIEPKTRQGYIAKIEKHIRPVLGQTQVARIDAEVIDSLYAQLRACKEHCGGRRFIEHRTANGHVCDEHKGTACRPPRPHSCPACRRTCRPHECRPLADGSIRVVHSIVKGALNRAVRWNWIAINPIAFVEPPPVPPPDPSPPSAEEAARIINEAWKDPDWGTLVWLAMILGPRRGELCALRWQHLDLDRGVTTVNRSIGQLAGQIWEKDTKTHQRRRLSLDEYTVEILKEHHERCESRASLIGAALSRQTFVFSLSPDGSTPMRPNTVTQRYGRMVKRLGIDTHLHALRHYSATELVAAGVDLRTVAGRLGHGGGGATTLRVYSAFVPASDKKAAPTLVARMPLQALTQAQPENRPPSPYEVIAQQLRAEIENGSRPSGSHLPSMTELAAEHGVSFGTAQRAVTQLKAAGLIDIVRGHRATVR
jgi:integrase